MKADQMGDAIALRMGERACSYAELEKISNQIAHVLKSQNVLPGDVVGVSMKRSFELVATVMAILKNGAAYLPLDPDYPLERLKFMVAHSRVSRVVTHEIFADLFIDSRADVLCFEKMHLEESFNKRLCIEAKNIDLAYVIYTSGSTGNPKGVAMNHKALVNLIEWQNEQTIHKETVTLQFTPLSFDVHFQEIFSTLLMGGELVLISEELRLDTPSLLRELIRKNVNRLFLPYVALNHLSEVALAHNLIPTKLKEVTTAGEQLKVTTHIRNFFKRMEDAFLYNHYGPSESHVVTSLTLEGDPDLWPDLPTIGKAIKNSSIHILDLDLNQVVSGIEGDIYLSGVCLANGYLHSPEITSERFIQHEKWGRLYKTGDIGFLAKDGNIVFLGRKDGQVKIRGYRIELGEIEVSLLRQKNVDGGAVKTLEFGGEHIICAYITGSAETSELREKLREELPDYMMPSHFIKIPHIPLTPSGKVDYKNLPLPKSTRPELSVEYAPAENEEHARLLKLWTKYLKIQGIGIDDNFFDLGGNSLMAIKILIDINLSSKKELTVLNLFELPTIRKIAAFIHDQRDELDDFLERQNHNSSSLSNDIAVIGMTGRFPGAQNIDEFWMNLIDVKSSIRTFSKHEVNPRIHEEFTSDPNYVFSEGAYPGEKSFDYKFFGMTPREAELMDPQQRKFLELTHECLEIAGYAPDSVQGSIGIFAGMGNSKYGELVKAHPEKVKTIGDFNVMLGLEKDYLASRVAFKLNLKGPALSIHTACSTSLVAIIEAVKSLRLKNCDMALAGGISISGTPRSGHLFQEGGILSKDGECRSFDSEASGTLFTDGAGVVVLKRLADAQRDGDHILAVVKGVGINNDGSHKMSFTAPSIMGQAQAILLAQRDANVTADTIGFIEGHGTATPVGDPIEVEALTKAFRKTTPFKKYCYLGSLKSNLGHLTGAAGVAGFIKAVKVIKTGLIPGTAHFQKPNPLLNLEDSPFIITNATSSFPQSQGLRRAGVSSFGVGGTNAHVIIEEYKGDLQTNKMDESPTLFKISAKTKKQSDLMAEELKEFLRKSDVSDWKKIAYTLETGRRDYRYRSFLSISTPDDLEKINKTNSAKGEFLKKPELVFMFPGQGSHYKQMGKGLYETNSVFRDLFDQCCTLINKYLPYNIKEVIFSESSEKNLDNTFYSQPAIFIVEYSLAMTLVALGLKPDKCLGHSIGEFVAATINGVFSLEDGLRAIAKRAEIMQSLPAGMMISVAMPEKELRQRLKNFELDVAAVNGANSCVVSGEVGAILTFKELLAQEAVASVELKTSHAFHSRMMKPALDAYKQFLQDLTLNKPTTPMFSTVTTHLESDLFSQADYWAKHMVETVRFSQTLKQALKQENILFLEVGTRNILSHLAKKEIIATDATAQIVTLMGASFHNEAASFNRALGELWLTGLKVTSPGIQFQESDRRKVVAPVYIFEENEIWLDHQSDTLNEEKPMSEKITTLEKRLIDIFESSSGMEIRHLGSDSTFLEMGMDSLFLTQAALILKKELKVSITFRQLMEDYVSIKDLATYLVDKVEVQSCAPVLENPVEKKEVQAFIPVPVMNSQVASSGVESIINRQLELMSQQMILLGIPSAKKTVEASLPEETIKAKTNVTNLKEAFGAQARIVAEKNTELKLLENPKIKKFFVEYTDKTKASKKFTQDNRKNHADPRVVTGFRPESKEIVYPIVIKKSYLQTLWDLDDNKYIDMTCGFGSNFFGNGNERIKKYVLRQIEEGVELGPQHPLVESVSQLVNELTGNERTAFCNTGSEAVLGAMRVARTVTGRQKIVVFSGSYHGINDEVILRGAKNGKSYPAAPGINGEAVSHMIVLDYGTAESLQKIKEIAHEVAAVLVEPVQSRRSDFHPAEFLKEVRKITLESNTCLIFDEIITGFRIHPAGAQGHFGIRADLCTYGKIVGGGMPIGIISGKSEYMDALDGGHWEYGDESTPTVGVTYFAGTFVRHPLALAAAQGALEILKEGGILRLQKLNRMAQEFVDDLNSFLSAEEAPIKMDNFGSLMKPKWKSDVNGGEILFALLRFRGVHVYDGFPWFVNLAHTEEELAEVLNAFKESVRAMQDMGLFTKKEQNIALDLKVFDQKGAPMVGAKIGRDEEGNPAWFVEDPKKAGEFYQL